MLPFFDREFVWATSWGVSTRLIGALVMTHSDDVGVVFPPAVAPVQVVIIQIGTTEEVKHQCIAIKGALLAKGIRCAIDDRGIERPGKRFFEWERKVATTGCRSALPCLLTDVSASPPCIPLVSYSVWQGVPLRMEVGPKDLAENRVTVRPRLVGSERNVLSTKDLAHTAASVFDLLASLQQQMFSRAERMLHSRTQRVSTYAQLVQGLAAAAERPTSVDVPSFFLAPWSESDDAEAAIKADCKATIRCYPLPQELSPDLQLKPGEPCFYTQQPATTMALFARAF
jgi:prolyl-tRNA synthetase